MNAPAASPATHCANCEHPLMPDARFCAHCGQKTPTHRLRLADILHDLVHAFTHADHSVLALLKGLALRPGHVVREYVSGKRKRHFGPFAFLVIVVGLSTIVISATSFIIQSPGAASNPILAWVQKHVNLIMLAQVPILAGITMLFFRGDKLNFAEHLVLAAYTSGARSVAFLVM